MIIPSKAQVDAICGSRTTLYQRIAGILAPVIYAALFLFIAVRWRSLPERIPTHYDFAGNVTGWGSRWMLAVMPAMGLLADIAMAVSLRFPQTWNTGVKITVLNRARVVRVVRDLIADLRITIALMLCVLTLWIVLRPENVPGWVLTAITLPLILIPLLRYFIRIRRAR